METNPSSLGLDAKDREILCLLQEDGRISNSKLAEKVLLSETPCWRRLQRLQADGYILGYQAVLSRRLLGFGVKAFVQVSIDVHAGDAPTRFESAVQKIPEIMSCHNITGEADYILVVVVTDLDAYGNFANDVLRRLPAVKAIRSSLSMRELKSSMKLPCLDGAKNPLSGVHTGTAQVAAIHPSAAVLDAKDREILSLLQEDGRMSNTKLAERVALSETPCWRRLHRLQSEGYILGYQAVLSRRLLGFGVQAFVEVSFDVHAGGATTRFETAVQSVPEILSCHAVTGSADYLLVVVAMDLDVYGQFTGDVLLMLPAVKSIRSSLSMREIKSSTRLPCFKHPPPG